MANQLPWVLPDSLTTGPLHANYTWAIQDTMPPVEDGPEGVGWMVVDIMPLAVDSITSFNNQHGIYLIIDRMPPVVDSILTWQGYYFMYIGDWDIDMAEEFDSTVGEYILGEGLPGITGD